MVGGAPLTLGNDAAAAPTATPTAADLLLLIPMSRTVSWIRSATVTVSITRGVERKTRWVGGAWARRRGDGGRGSSGEACRRECWR